MDWGRAKSVLILAFLLLNVLLGYQLWMDVRERLQPNNNVTELSPETLAVIKQKGIELSGGIQEKRIYPKASFDRGNKPGGFTKRPFTPRTGKGESPRLGSFNREAKPPYTPRPAQDGGRSLPKRPYKPRAADADKRPFTKAPWVPKAEEGQGGTFKPRKPSGKYDRGGNSSPQRLFL